MKQMNFRSFGQRASALFVGLTLAACATSPAPSAPTSIPATATAAVAPAAAVSTATAAPTSAPAASATPAAKAAPTGTVTAGQSVAIAASTKINLNTATEADFLKIPGVGARMVREFLEYRPYTSVQQFKREIGKYVDAAQVNAYLNYVYVPVAVNEADAATLQQIPGVDANLAAALIAGRPYAGNDAFLTKLGELLSPAQATAAKVYLKN